MDYEITVDTELGIIKSKSTGIWNIPDSDAVTQELKAKSIEHNIVKVLIDHSELEINISQIVAYNRPLQLKSQFPDIYPKVAFVSPKNKHALYSFFTLVAQNRGIQFKTFKTYSDAAAWLIDTTK